MQSPSAIHDSARPRPVGLAGRLRRILLRKLWLPRGVYEALPYAYIGLGLTALASAIYLPGWTWVLPYLALIGLGCLHAGLALIALRYRFRRGHAPGSDRD